MRAPPHNIEAEVALLGGLLMVGESFVEVSAEISIVKKWLAKRKMIDPHTHI